MDYLADEDIRAPNKSKRQVQKQKGVLLPTRHTMVTKVNYSCPIPLGFYEVLIQEQRSWWRLFWAQWASSLCAHVMMSVAWHLHDRNTMLLPALDNHWRKSFLSRVMHHELCLAIFTAKRQNVIDTTTIGWVKSTGSVGLPLKTTLWENPIWRMWMMISRLCHCSFKLEWCIFNLCVFKS